MVSYKDFERVLLEELQQALGCTEPIAIALCAAKVKEYLTSDPRDIEVYCSKNIIKNAWSVLVPNSQGMKGILTAVALGIVGGKASKNLRVLEDITCEDIERAKKLIEDRVIKTHVSNVTNLLYIKIVCKTDSEEVTVEIKDCHDNITYVEVDGKVIYKSEISDKENCTEDRSFLSVRSIIDFADNVDLKDVPKLLERLDLQIKSNMEIAKNGLEKGYGAKVGPIIKMTSQGDMKDEIKAMTCSASDARMGGCSLPVVINSGSGNQGITTSVPVIVFSQRENLSKERLYRGLMVSNLIAIYQKYYIGKLSAFCGAVSAGGAAACGIGYLIGLKEEKIESILTNALATSGGIVCDGAKASCASKIAVALDNSLLALEMAKRGIEFEYMDGIVGSCSDKTVKNIGKMASEGMKYTDDKILEIMLEGN
ncbi:L-serine ammonia-lyase, iron-sulfur-dependent, subunit alpha [Lagierella sp.]|uniref:L-cysteine desulfidase family protein n=1 Tax=Lagierella sp. TaxID=2849657 RepID=UPI002602811B|nr:L-serine ammonia-lyase, iron-sulfur-dependent, subunit alpha [Lagierella sp.]